MYTASESISATYEPISSSPERKITYSKFTTSSSEITASSGKTMPTTSRIMPSSLGVTSMSFNTIPISSDGNPVSSEIVHTSPIPTIPKVSEAVPITMVNVQLLGDVSDETINVRDHLLQLLGLSNAYSLAVTAQPSKISGGETITNLTIVISSKNPRSQVSEQELDNAVNEILSSLNLREYEKKVSPLLQTSAEKSWIDNHTVMIGMIVAFASVLVLIIIIAFVVIKRRKTLRNSKGSYIDEGMSLGTKLESVTKEKPKEFENPLYDDMDC
ncbi:uncharacterized protein LOC117333001 [Pecten maximus]|uniref:uncharacterized protein LOC117333001 n=1 Tax=Pecten maximus TaxID=6579 RepID=UPI001458B9C4|nr:uncharacterized protein LOC117333001 [Pecten maximus]